MTRRSQPTDFAAPFAPLGAATAPAMAEAMQFMARRMRAYGDYFEALATASEPTDIVRANLAFMRRTGDEYAAEAKAAAKLTTEAAQQPAPKA